MKAEQTLQRDQTTGWRLGLRNLFQRENGQWWGTSRWWIQLLIWACIANGILVLLRFVLPTIANSLDGIDTSELANLPNGAVIFFTMIGLALPLGVIILTQGTIIKEKLMGTMAWVLSKPVSRTAFYLAKLGANALGFFIIMIALQSVLAYGLIWLDEGSPIPIIGFLKGIGILTLILLYYLSLTLLVEVLSEKQSLVLGVTLGNALGGALLVNLFPGLALVTPFALMNMAPLVVEGSPPEGFPIWMPLAATSLFSLIFIIIAIWQINRKSL